LARRAGRI